MMMIIISSAKHVNNTQLRCGVFYSFLLSVLFLAVNASSLQIESFSIKKHFVHDEIQSNSNCKRSSSTILFAEEDFSDGNKISSSADQLDTSINSREQQRPQRSSGDLLRLEKSSGLLRLAQLSLQDYEWRNGFFKNREADRRVEESLARMMGDEASYVRPMDASEKTIGPLGLWEKSSVEWIQQVIDEEARRAREIVRLGGIFVRPMDATGGGNEQLGPLGIVERRVVDFLESIRQSERERSNLKVLRPKDLEASKRGPLGEAELRASEAIRDILNSERTRMEQSRIRDGIVRPIDIPGPIGDLEMAVVEVVRAEEQRKMESEQNPDAVLIRPMNAKKKGPLGELEEQAIEAVKKLTEEEKMRVRNIQKFLDENRPMQQVEPSALGMVETVVVGIVRAPILLFQILSRVRDLIGSETLVNADAKVLKEKKARNIEKK